MSEENAKDRSSEGSSSKGDEPSALSVPESQVEAKLEEIIEAVPAPRRDEFRHSVREFMGFVESSGPKIDPEVARILAASNDKDNENKFKYLTQKQELEAEESKREHQFKIARHSSLVKMLWPVLIAVIVLVLGCIGAGIYLAATGHETLGFSILSATITALFAYLGGLGTPYLFKDK
ncbi:MAG TPA: hypothetical protein VD835_08675 [Pyrinomonadaceae bacterium]|nr:hypothetical protein [Pyrinomonadaceae bacterium]